MKTLEVPQEFLDVANYEEIPEESDAIQPESILKLGDIVTMQVCPDGVTPCAAPNYCARPENSCYNGIYQR